MKLWKGDCLERMKEIPDNSIDMCLTDPPYGTTACKWDTVIPFEPMWEQLKRITKDNGAICLFGSEPFSSHLRMSNIKMFRYDWFWNKNRPSGFAQAKNKPMSTIENISVFSQGKSGHIGQCKNRINYYPQGLIALGKTVKNNSKRFNKDSCFIKRANAVDEYVQEFTNYPRNLLNFKRVDKTVHLTQKPVALLEYLIKTYTLENETVLDFTMGSGSTGVAAKNLNRKFIGIEKDDKYFEIAKKRIFPEN